MKQLFCFVLLLISCGAHAQELKRKRFIIILDGSLSMSTLWSQNETRYDYASRFINNLIDSAYRRDSTIEFSLRMYGHQNNAQKNDCYDTKREVMFSGDNRTQIRLRLAALRPLGVSSAAYALEESFENDLVNKGEYEYTAILITDGNNENNNSNTNPCEVLLKKYAKSHTKVLLIAILPGNCYSGKTWNCMPNIATNEDRYMPLSINRILLDIDMHAIIPEKSITFGYLMVANNIHLFDLQLHYQENKKFRLLEKINISNLSDGQKIKLKAGNYKLTYSKAPNLQTVDKEFLIVKDSTSKIHLD